MRRGDDIDMCLQRVQMSGENFERDDELCAGVCMYTGVLRKCRVDYAISRIIRRREE